MPSRFCKIKWGYFLPEPHFRDCSASRSSEPEQAGSRPAAGRRQAGGTDGGRAWVGPARACPPMQMVDSIERYRKRKREGPFLRDAVFLDVSPSAPER